MKNKKGDGNKVGGGVTLKRGPEQPMPLGEGLALGCRCIKDPATKVPATTGP